jgi:hypothetical protein
MTDEFRLERMPTELADLARDRREKEAARKARYEQSERGKAIRAQYAKTRTPQSRKDFADTRQIKRENRPFIVWDGEQPRDTGYSLFGNSEGIEICHPHLSTQECLDLILDTKEQYPDGIQVIFSGDFDASWILNDLSWRQLGRLKHYNTTQWNGYLITHVPHKWFSVRKGDTLAKIFDVWSFFGSGLIPALEDWEIGPFPKARDIEIDNPRLPSLEEMDGLSEVEIVATFKMLRGEFEYKDIEQIRRYMHLELKYTKEMCEKLRRVFLDAGYLPNSWHGPGALSRLAMTRHKVYAAKSVTPRPVQVAARLGYFGGRFTQHLAGHVQRPVYSVDWNSAYPYAATKLPNLANGRWRFENEPSRMAEAIAADKFAIYNIFYNDRQTGTIEDEPEFYRFLWGIHPLPFRMEDGSILFPAQTKAWFWSPEAKMVWGDKRATFYGAWIFDEDNSLDRPFEWMNEYYDRRLLLKRLGNPAQYTFKTIINGAYGQLAQRVGWDQVNKLPPKTHQLEWAGYITSHCRAGMLDMVRRIGDDNVISIDTDGILSLIPVPLYPGEHGDALGQWKTKEYEDGAFWQSGVYALKRDGEWLKGETKTRGIARGKYDPEELVRLCDAGERTFALTKSMFVGYGMAFNSQFEKKNVWVDVDQTYTFGGNGATYHNPRKSACDNSCWHPIHRLKNRDALRGAIALTAGYGSKPPYESAPHYLPWEENSDIMIESKNKFDNGDVDITWFFAGDDDV